MKFFRTHITKAYSLVVILLGFSLHFFEPIQDSRTHSEFTSWLDAKIKTEENTDVRKLIMNLANDTDELESVIRKASEIVSQNSDDFELPVTDDADVFDLIVDEWNSYQNSSAGMGKAVVVETIKSNAVSQKEAASFKKIIKSLSESCINNLVSLETDWDIYTTENFSKPFKSGVAINAP